MAEWSAGDAAPTTSLRTQDGSGQRRGGGRPVLCRVRPPRALVCPRRSLAPARIGRPHPRTRRLTEPSIGRGSCRLSAPRRGRWPIGARVSSCAHSTSPRGTRTRRDDEARVDGPRRCDAMRPRSPTKPPWKSKNRMFLTSEALPTRFHGASEPPPRASETYLTVSTLRYVSELQLPRRLCTSAPSELQLPKNGLCAPQRVPHERRDGRPQRVEARSLRRPLGLRGRDARMSEPPHSPDRAGAQRDARCSPRRTPVPSSSTPPGSSGTTSHPPSSRAGSVSITNAGHA